MHARTADAGVISTWTWLAIDVTIRCARVNQPFSTCAPSPSMIDTIEGTEGESRQADGAVAESVSTRAEKVLANVRVHSRQCAYRRTKARWQEEWYWDGNLFVCSKSAPLNDVSIEERLDVRYWINRENSVTARSTSGFKSEGAVIAFSSKSHFLDLFFADAEHRFVPHATFERCLGDAIVSFFLYFLRALAKCN